MLAGLVRARHLICTIFLVVRPGLSTWAMTLTWNRSRSSASTLIGPSPVGGTIMRERQINLPTIGLIAGTRVALGIGLGLILADRFSLEQRRAAGWALVAVGALTTIPLVAEVLG